YQENYRFAAANACLEQLLKIKPDAILGRLLRAQVRDQQGGSWRPSSGGSEEARADYRRILALAPDQDVAPVGLAKNSLPAHGVPEALEQFENLQQRRPKDPAVLLGLARCRSQLGELEKAEQLLETLLAANPRHGAALTERGKLALQAGQPERAEKWLRE